MAKVDLSPSDPSTPPKDLDPKVTIAGGGVVFFGKPADRNAQAVEGEVKLRGP